MKFPFVRHTTFGSTALKEPGDRVYTLIDTAHNFSNFGLMEDESGSYICRPHQILFFIQYAASQVICLKEITPDGMIAN